MEGRIAALEDAKRQHNLKIRNVPEDITAKAPDRVPRDLLICFQSMQSKQLVQAAVHNTPTYRFEGADLSFFNDLSRSTMEWRQSLRPITQHLRDHAVAYRWGPGRKLTMLHDGKRIQLQQQSEAGKFLSAMGLPTPETIQTSISGTDLQPLAQMWDICKVRPFYPKIRPAAGEPNLAGT
ncbi:Hypothetical predicted protein [Pelobates cultripes]|uniref:Uncharacterized protein n=1 Tax=Pelobates cultripes TaxID=61616 RepID=A0AAD1WLX4_PELCU|nr:Hypothetical predicted protein [Pelobates cultripes]